MTETPVVYKVGDQVYHPNRPEWGTGKVHETQPITHEGKPAQRIRVIFVNAGTKWLNAAIAPLRHMQVAVDSENNGPKVSPRNTPEHIPVMGSGGRVEALSSGGESLPQEGWLNVMEDENPLEEQLLSLPPEIDDIFLSPVERLVAALKTFEFSLEPGPLFKWACIQTKLDDPLSKLSRVELESAFQRWSRKRDDALFDLLRQIRREGLEAEAKQAAKAFKHPKAKDAIRKGLR